MKDFIWKFLWDTGREWRVKVSAIFSLKRITWEPISTRIINFTQHVQLKASKIESITVMSNILRLHSNFIQQEFALQCFIQGKNTWLILYFINRDQKINDFRFLSFHMKNRSYSNMYIQWHDKVKGERKYKMNKSKILNAGRPVKRRLHFHYPWTSVPVHPLTLTWALRQTCKDEEKNAIVKYRLSKKRRENERS